MCPWHRLRLPPRSLRLRLSLRLRRPLSLLPSLRLLPRLLIQARVTTDPGLMPVFLINL